MCLHHQIDASSSSSPCLTPIPDPGWVRREGVVTCTQEGPIKPCPPFPCLPFTSRMKRTDFIPARKLWAVWTSLEVPAGETCPLKEPLQQELETEEKLAPSLPHPHQGRPPPSPQGTLSGPLPLQRLTSAQPWGAGEATAHPRPG